MAKEQNSTSTNPAEEQQIESVVKREEIQDRISLLFAEADAGQISFVDAPISGGQAGAENAQLSIMCGGDAGALERALPVMEVYSKICRRLGDSGAGQMTKMCNQIAIAGLVQGLSEALHFAE